MLKLRIFSSVFLVFLVLGVARGVEKDSAGDDLFRQMVELVPVIFEDMDPARPGVAYAKAPNLHYQGPCYLFAFLYKTARKDNPYYGDRKLFDASVAMCDHIIATNRGGLEWPMYCVCQVHELLKDELPAATVARWKEGARYYVEHRGLRPFFYTSFNHEAWNCLAVYRAGQVFGEPEWMAQGEFLWQRLFEIRHPLGYWEEGPHHGPSMKYNHAMVEPILLYADYSGDETAKAAGARLADFMIRYSLPDGSYSGALDGRQSYFLSLYSATAYGFDRWPRGKTLNRLMIENRKRYDTFSPKSRFYSLSDFYANFGHFFPVDEYLSLLPDAPMEPLPQSKDGFVAEDHIQGFDAGLVRDKGWCVVLSGIFSDVPKEIEDIYRMERQSRIDIWHESMGLIVGGGHNKTREKIPLANVALVNRYEGDMDFGEMVGDDFQAFRSLYFPRAVKTDINLEAPKLHLVFGQGAIDFLIRPVSREKLTVEYRYDARDLEKMFVQLPVIVFTGGRIKIDGRGFTGEDKTTIERTIEIENPAMKSRVMISIPEGRETRFRYPISPSRWYSPMTVPQRYEPVYNIGLISVKVDKPHGEGGGIFTLEISK